MGEIEIIVISNSPPFNRDYSLSDKSIYDSIYRDTLSLINV